MAAGLPEHVPSVAIHRACGSSQQAGDFAAQGVIAGLPDGSQVIAKAFQSKQGAAPAFATTGEGFAIFQINIKKRPNEWYTHGEIARIASAKGDFPTAIKELNLSLQTCPDIAKGQIKGLIAKLEQKQDINP